VTTTLPVVLIAENLAPSVLEVLGSDVEIRHVDGTDRAALLPALADAAAVLIRSAPASGWTTSMSPPPPSAA
jgi:D-3-phosphoglycerate dehydrogenase